MKLLEKSKHSLIRSRRTLNYPHEGSVVPKVNALVGGLIPSREFTTLPDEKLRCGEKSLMYVKKTKINKKFINLPFYCSKENEIK